MEALPDSSVGCQPDMTWSWRTWSQERLLRTILIVCISVCVSMFRLLVPTSRL